MNVLKTLLFSILIGVTIQGFSCLSASQSRIFPVGKHQENIVVVEFKLQRIDGYNGAPIWNGATYIKEYGNNFTEISSAISDTLFMFPDDTYERVLIASFNKSLAIIQSKFPTIKKIQYNTLEMCYAKATCFDKNIVFDSLNKTISIKTDSVNLHELSYKKDSKSIPSELYNKAKTNGETDPYHFLEKNLYINSVRTFSIDGKKIFLIHLVNGQSIGPINTTYYRENETYLKNIDASDIKQAIFHEEVLHHGIGFDILIIQ